MIYKLDPKIKILLAEKNLTLEKANINKLDNILKLYTERISWFKKEGINQWQHYLELHPRKEFIDIINNSNYFILKENDNIIAGFELSTNNKCWTDYQLDTYYINKLVIKVGYKNIGKLVFKICKSLLKNNNKSYLRLICLNSNDKLNEIYKNYGFEPMGIYNDGYDNYTLMELNINKESETLVLV